MLRVWAFVLSWVVAVPVILYGALFLGCAAVEAYIVASGRVQPGDPDPIFPGTFAVPVQDALIEMGIGAVIIGVGFRVRKYARRLRLADS